MSTKLKTSMICLRQSGGVPLAEAYNLGVVEHEGRFGWGRSKGNLYILVEARGVTREHTERQLVETIAKEYERGGGSITANLRQAIAAANRYLYEANQKALPEMKVTAGVTCAVLREKDLFLAQAGPALAYLLHQGRLYRVPADSPWLTPDRAEKGDWPAAIMAAELGTRAEIEPELFHSTLQPGDSLVLCSYALAGWAPQARIKQALANTQAEEIVASLSLLAGERDFSLIALAITGEMEEEEISVGEEAVAVSEESLSLAGRLSREWQAIWQEATSLLGGLLGPFRRQVALPSRQAPEAASPECPRPKTPPVAPPAEKVRQPVSPAERPTPGRPIIPPEQEAAYPMEQPLSVPERQPVGEAKGLSGRLQGLWEGAQASISRAMAGRKAEAEVSGPLPLPEVPEAAAPLRADAAPRKSLVGIPWRARATGVAEAAPAKVTRGVLARPLPTPLLLAVAGTIILGLLIMGVLFFSRYQEEQARAQRFASLVAAAQDKKGRVTASTERAMARLLLEQAQQDLKEALTLRPGDPEATALYDSVMSMMDVVNAVIRLTNVTVLVEVPEAQASLGRLVVSGIDVYFLDLGQNRVYKYLLTAPGAPTIQKLDVNPVLMRKGDEIGNIILGDLVDITWVPAGGLRRAGRLLALDSSGNLIEYDPATGLRPLPVRDAQGWRKPKATGGFAGNFYLLDTQQSQILKYEPTAKGYESPPIAWLQSPMDLTSMVDMAIDGDIYLLGLDGRVHRFRGGQPLIFPMAELDRPMSNPAGIFATPETQYLYVVDPGNKRIVQFGKDGGFLRQFRYGGKEDYFDSLRSVHVDERAGRLYITSGKRLLTAEIPR